MKLGRVFQREREMSEVEYIEPSSDSFWEVGQYKRAIKRCEDGYKLCSDLMLMVSERAEIEKAYAKSLKSWAKKWSDHIQKGSEYGSMKSTYLASHVEADKKAELHLNVHNVLNDELNKEIKEWQKQNYPKSIVNQLKTPREFDEEFKKAQKPWAKKYELVQKLKKEYHLLCKSMQTAKVQQANSVNDPTITGEQKKKLDDKVDKYKKDVEVAKSKYKQALEDLNGYNSRYIEDMKQVFSKCEAFEKQRLDFFIEKFLKFHNYLNVAQSTSSSSNSFSDIYTEFLATIRGTNPERDLINWSKDFGPAMHMNWPVFEEYSEELKTISKGSRASKVIRDTSAAIGSSNGITMTSIKHKTDSYTGSQNESTDSASYKAAQPTTPVKTSSIGGGSDTYSNNNFNNQTATSSNPFGDDDDNNNDDNESNEFQRESSSLNGDTDVAPVQQRADDEQYLNVKVVALYDYTSAEDDELSFKKGQEFIKLAHEDERGWCLGKIGEKIGLYPATYAEES